MNRILILLRVEPYRHLLIRGLMEQHDLVFPDADGIPSLSDKPVDICLVDGSSLDYFGEWLRTIKTAITPIRFPVLAIVSRQELMVISRELVDDVIVISPHLQKEAQIRVESLLSNRKLSLKINQTRKELLRLSKALDYIGDAICITDDSGVPIHHNTAFSKLLGFNLLELRKKGSLYSLLDDPESANHLLRDVRQGNGWAGEAAFRNSANEIIYTLLKVEPIIGVRGSRLGLINICAALSAQTHSESVEHDHHALTESLRDTIVALTSTLDSDEVLDRILANVGRVVPHDVANIMMIENNQARIVRSRGYGALGLDKSVPLNKLPIATTLSLQWMWKNRRSLTIANTSTEVAWHAALQVPNLHSYTGAPIQLKGEIIGFLNLGSTTPGYFSPIHAERLQAFAEQAAIAIQNADLHKKAQAFAAVQERQRLARNLHDAVSQTLFSASVIAEALPRLWHRDPNKVWPRLNQLHRLTKGALAEMRNLLLELRPDALLDTDLDDLLRQLTTGMMGRKRIEISQEIDSAKRLPADVHVAFYYIAQEALNNIIKHSGATQAVVKLRRKAAELELEIWDNGCGFNLDRTPSTSLGIIIMRERAQAIHARITISSAKNKGTSVRVNWAF